MIYLPCHQALHVLIVCLLLTLCCHAAMSLDVTVRITYRDPNTGRISDEAEQIARYGASSVKEPRWGWLVHVQTLDGGNHACTPPVNYPNYQWVALVQRGECKFEQKIHNAGMAGNASAVIVYNNQGTSVVHMSHDNPGLVAVFVSMAQGEVLARLADSGICVLVELAQNAGELPSVDYYNTGGCLTTTTTTPSQRTTPGGGDNSGDKGVSGLPQDRDDREQEGEEPGPAAQQSSASRSKGLSSFILMVMVILTQF